jgi:hypothetical protein
LKGNEGFCLIEKAGVEKTARTEWQRKGSLAPARLLLYEIRVSVFGDEGL